MKGFSLLPQDPVRSLWTDSQVPQDLLGHWVLQGKLVQEVSQASLVYQELMVFLATMGIQANLDQRETRGLKDTLAQ